MIACTPRHHATAASPAPRTITGARHGVVPDPSCLSASTARLDRVESSERLDRLDSTENAEANDPSEPTLSAEPIDPRLATEPTLPIERTEPSELTDRIDPLERHDHSDPSVISVLPCTSSDTYRAGVEPYAASDDDQVGPLPDYWFYFVLLGSSLVLLVARLAGLGFPWWWVPVPMLVVVGIWVLNAIVVRSMIRRGTLPTD